MARHKGAVGFEIGTSKLGAYSMEDTLEIFEREGYVKYKDLDQYFKDCYFDFENKLSEKEFVEKSKKNILRSHKYKQFINNEVKMCSKCGKVKPLSSFYYNTHKSNKEAYCSKCCHELVVIWKKKNKDKVSIHNSVYYNKNKEELNVKRREWQRKNRNRSRLITKRCYIKKVLKRAGYKENLLTREKLDLILNLKIENKIGTYEEVVEKFGSVLND